MMYAEQSAIGGTIKECRDGASGEKGCLQWMPDSWRGASKKYLGYVASITRVNDEYVSLLRVQDLLNQGYKVDAIARIWNQGNAGECIKGINEHNVAYDSCRHVQKVLFAYNNQ